MFTRMSNTVPWTAERVAARLVAAFRRLPGCPVMSAPTGFVRGFLMLGEEVAPFGWPERYVGDLRRRQILMTWARCTAAGESVSERYRALGWSRSSAERHRAAALQAIADALNAAQEQRGLDSGTERAGASRTRRSFPPEERP